MPTYTYRCDQGHEKTVIHSITEDPVFHCQVVVGNCHCGGADECSLPMQRVIRPATFLIPPRQAPATNTRTKGLDKNEGYQPLLARFPGDPQAFTSGKNARDKLIDQRLRDGWIEVPAPRDQKLTGKPDGYVSAAERAAKKVKEGKVDIGP